MKKIKIFLPLLAIALLAACSNDPKMMISPNPVAPVLSEPSHATAAYNADSAAYVLNLDSTGVAETFIGTPANYGQPTTVTYSLQIDNSGDNFANAQTIATSTKDTISVTIPQLYLAVTGDVLNAPLGVQSSFDVRVMTTIGSNLITTYSNTVTIKINPLPALKSYDLVSKINMWYIIGLADGNWNYSAAGIGSSMIPLSLVTGKAYNNAGDGTFTYTGYFQASRGFKIVSGAASDMGTWSNQWGSSDGGLTPVYKDGGSKNFTVPSDGYYTITLNSIKNSLSIVPAASAPSNSYTSMGLIGEFNSWATDVNLTPCDASLGTNNHVWYTTYTFTTDFTPPVGSGGCKFRADGSWNSNWGAGTWPYGLGTNGGTNIPFMSGTYTILFNDVDGCFYFIKQ
ncbi:MAG: SusE domain-containing protein [Bacteroidales bacterium]|nr:SusE domain-containing protein [Bacteroidales bacterium]